VIRQESSITDIALDCGFSCSQTFSRAFRRQFGIAPRALRSKECRTFGGFSGVSSRPRISGPLISRWEQSPVRIEARPALRLAYVRNIGLYWNADGAISEAFRRLADWARMKGLWSGAREVIGLCPDNSAVTPAGFCLYDACLPVPEEIGEDDVISIQTIPAGHYAVLSVSATAREMESAWQWLTLTWTAETGMACDLIHSHEVFPLVDDRMQDPQIGAELCLRLQRH
ncbi:MAG: GyrI-like domain-containing protein, partial [Pseudomonadota bacterium]